MPEGNYSAKIWTLATTAINEGEPLAEPVSSQILPNKLELFMTDNQEITAHHFYM